MIARVNRRARRLIVRVDPHAGEILVTAPSRRSLAEAIRFAGEKIPWIAAELARGGARPFEIGGVCPLRGTPHRIVAAASSRASARAVEGGEPIIEVGGAAEHVNRRIVEFVKRVARRDLEAAVERHARALGRTVRAISIRDSRSRWGSCSANGTLSFSWRLALAPPEILDYVAAHECAHLVRLDHSPKFWRIVLDLGADAQAARRWFDRHGESLHAWGVKAVRAPASDFAVDDDGERRRRRL